MLDDTVISVRRPVTRGSISRSLEAVAILDRCRNGGRREPEFLNTGGVLFDWNKR